MSTLFGSFIIHCSCMRRNSNLFMMQIHTICSPCMFPLLVIVVWVMFPTYIAKHLRYMGMFCYLHLHWKLHTCEELLLVNMPGFAEPASIHYPWMRAWMIAEKRYHAYMVICGNSLMSEHELKTMFDKFPEILQTPFWCMRRLFAALCNQGQCTIATS